LYVHHKKYYSTGRIKENETERAYVVCGGEDPRVRGVGEMT
jgi:hypothetical protein